MSTMAALKTDTMLVPPKPFTPSPMQADFFDWIKTGQGSVILEAVAGSGKSTTIRRSLQYIPPAKHVLILSFSRDITADMKAGVDKLAAELEADFRNVSVRTFHGLGFSAIAKRLGKSAKDIEVDDKKLRKLFKDRFPAEIYEIYGDFVPKLVGLGKGYGIDCLVPNDEREWFNIIGHHDLSLDSETANEAEAVKLAMTLLWDSNDAAEKGWIDFDDQLYLPVLWKLKLWRHDYVFIDEAQDTNPIRRAVAKMALQWGGRLIAVGDAHQSIYGFTGASVDALDLIRAEFKCADLPLTVSYRCPKVAEALVQRLVPQFTVHDDAPEGAVRHMSTPEGTARLGAHDAILCRNTAPLVDLAFTLLAQGRGCIVLGKDIGEGLVNLIKHQKAAGIDRLIVKLEQYAEREVAKYMAKGEEAKAESLNDRMACVLTLIRHLPEADRTIPKLIAKIEGMFADKSNVLTLCTAHRAKGKEWRRVAILAPELMPSKYARQEWQYEQEVNLQYVAWTRFQEELIFLDGDDR